MGGSYLPLATTGVADASVAEAEGAAGEAEGAAGEAEGAAGAMDVQPATRDNAMNRVNTFRIVIFIFIDLPPTCYISPQRNLSIENSDERNF
jgi:hypothetical protein